LALIFTKWRLFLLKITKSYKKQKAEKAYFIKVYWHLLKIAKSKLHIPKPGTLPS
jgi:hypothetical protein